MNNHAIILPLKETFSTSSAGAVSIWVKDYLKYSLFKKKIYIFTQHTKEKLIIKKNVFQIKINKKIFSNSTYIQKVLNEVEKKNISSLEIHNRPEYLNYFSFNSSVKINLIFHNDPNKLRGSKTQKEKLSLLSSCNKIIFVSKFLKKKFFENLNINQANNTEIIYNSISKLKKFPKKEKIIIFSGKLNSLKGYDVFGKTITNILDKNPEWKAFVFGNEPREKYNFSHKNLIIKNWISHSDLLKFYEKSSISVVIPKWQEPFGRTAMESASRGCAVITSLSGGLQETFHNNLIIKKVTEKSLFKKIQFLINNPKNLKKIQYKNFTTVLHNIKNTSKKIDNLIFNVKNKEFYNYDNNKKKILQISTFGEKTDYRIFNLSVSKKLSNGFIRNGHDVLNVDYRNYNKFLNNNDFDAKILKIFHNYRPHILIMGHNNVLSKKTLLLIKNKGCKIIIWYEDALAESGPDYEKSLSLLEKNNHLIDKYFLTTHPDAIKTKIPKKKCLYMPVPVDPNIEYGEFYKAPKTYDLFFALSHGVNSGTLKANYIDERIHMINKLINLSKDNLKFYFLGINNIQPKWNFEYDYLLSRNKIALNLSRGKAVKYYSSNRIAQLMGNGCVVAIDKKVKFSDFFTAKEVIFYKNPEDLIKKILKVKNNHALLYKMGRAAKKKYFNLFSNLKVSQYLIDQTFNLKNKYNYLWFNK